MAIRVGGYKKPVIEEPVEEAAVPEEEMLPEEETPLEEELSVEDVPEEPMEESYSHKASPMVAGYKGPEMGPFACVNCEHFSPEEANTCALVDGYIDEAGLCNLFTGMAQETEAEPMEEAPIEEPEPEMASEEMA